MRGITLTSIADVSSVVPKNRYCLSLHPISVRTELVREGAYYILWTKANYVQDMGMIANSTRSDRDKSIFSQQKE